MAQTIEITESVPTDYPTVTGSIAEPVEGFNKAVWQRIEGWIRHRWSERSCIFTVEGPGAWQPPLTPASIVSSEVWTENYQWEVVALNPSPLGGYELEEVGPYRFTATVGSSDDPPDAILEAFRRLAEYMNSIRGSGSGALIKSEEIKDAFAVEYGPPNAAARALQYSGAADLLRPFRNLGSH